MKFCHECGKPSSDNVKFCGFCGHPFPAQEYPTPPAPPQPPRIIDVGEYPPEEYEEENWFGKQWANIQGWSNRNKIIAAVAALIVLCCLCTCPLAGAWALGGNLFPTSTATLTATPLPSYTPQPSATFTPSPTLTASPQPSPTATLEPSQTPTATQELKTIVQPTLDPNGPHPTKTKASKYKGCCKFCDPAKNQPCGDSCIPLGKTCHLAPGCACAEE